MAITKKMIDDVAILSMKGKLMGGPETTAIHDMVKELVEEGTTRVVLDLTKVSWLNSTGLGTIMASSTTISNAGGELKIAGLQDKAKGLFSIAKLDSVFKIYGTPDRAAADF